MLKGFHASGLFRCLLKQHCGGKSPKPQLFEKNNADLDPNRRELKA